MTKTINKISKQTQIELLIDETYWAKKYQVMHIGYSKFGFPTECIINYSGLGVNLVWNKRSLPDLEWAKTVDENYIPCFANQLTYADTIGSSIDQSMFDRFIKLMQNEILGIDLGN